MSICEPTTSVEDFKLGIPGVYPDVPADVYHAQRAVSSSMLKAVFTRSPKYAKGIMDGAVKLEGEALNIGAAAHSMALTPDSFAREFIAAEQCAATVKASGERCKNSGTKCVAGEWVCGVHGKGMTCDYASSGAKVLTLDDHRRVKAIHDSLWSKSDVRELLEFASDFELSALWICNDTGLLCKARFDILCRELAVVPDLKTCRALKWFENDANDRAYGIQLAHYRRGAIVYGLADSMNIVAIESDGVFDCGLFLPTQRFMDDGVRDMRDCMNTVAKCMKKDNWPGACPGKTPLRTKDEIKAARAAGE